MKTEIGIWQIHPTSHSGSKLDLDIRAGDRSRLHARWRAWSHGAATHYSSPSSVTAPSRTTLERIDVTHRSSEPMTHEARVTQSADGTARPATGIPEANARIAILVHLGYRARTGRLRL